MAEKAEKNPQMVRVRETRSSRQGAGSVLVVQERVIEVPASQIPSGAEKVPDTTEIHDWRIR